MTSDHRHEDRLLHRGRHFFNSFAFEGLDHEFSGATSND